jgi:hydrogenase-4 component F
LPLLNNQWLKLAFIFYLVGYGTKMGLAPLHSWLPDTYSEAPSGVTALMSSALINCAVLALLRVQQVFIAQGLAGFTRELFIIFGISSLAVASFFILGQKDYKRLLAYSSIEHMGILALSIGLGGVAITGGLLHIINHSLIKGILFMTAGNIIACYKTRETAKVAGIIKLAPFTGVLWFAGFLAITGTPPFGLFISKFMILKAALEQGQFGISIAFLAILATIFIGMSASWLQMSFGNWTHNTSALGTATLPTTKNPKEYFLTLLPGAILCIFAILLGLYIPPALSEMIQSAASLLGGTK